MTLSASIQEEVLHFLVSTSTPQEIIAFHASDAAQKRLRVLLEANRVGTLSDAEKAELEEASQVNNFIILLKAKAYKQRKPFEENHVNHRIALIDAGRSQIND